jgi:hypothetical protein
MIEIMEKQGKNDYPEDVYFSCYNSVFINKPKLDRALFFSVEETFSKISFGCHRPWCDFNDKRFLLYHMYKEVKELYKHNDIPPPLPPKPTRIMMSTKKKIIKKKLQFFINF